MTNTVQLFPLSLGALPVRVSDNAATAVLDLEAIFVSRPDAKWAALLYGTFEIAAVSRDGNGRLIVDAPFV